MTLLSILADLDNALFWMVYSYGDNIIIIIIISIIIGFLV